MGLSAVMHTALSGIGAASTILETTANNLANFETSGFKSSSVRLGKHAPPMAAYGGSGGSPIQSGNGLQVASAGIDFLQGPFQIDDHLPLLALQGEGLFILHSSEGVRLFSRDGQFHLNTNSELVNGEGDHVLGFGVDADGQVDRRQLGPLEIRLGSFVKGANGASVALRSFSIAKNGKIVGQCSDGSSRTLGQLRLARFANPAGLLTRFGNRFASTPASGFALEGDPGSDGAATIVSGATEFSNAETGRELVEMTLAGNLFRTNLAVIHTADQMLGALFFPWRVGIDR